jgi:hypothetical protein
MLYAIKSYPSTSQRDQLIDVLTECHQDHSMTAPDRSYWSRFDTDYLKSMITILS